MRVNAIRIDPSDNVAVALRDIQPGESVTGSNEKLADAVDPIPSGHKVAVKEIEAGKPVTRYGETIGTASAVIKPGQHVHTHNIQGEAV